MNKTNLKIIQINFFCFIICIQFEYNLFTFTLWYKIQLINYINPYYFKIKIKGD